VIKKKIILLIEIIHLKLFGQPLSLKMAQFLTNVSWLFYCGLIVVPISLLIATVFGRLIGPEEFGKYNLVVLISSYLMIVIFYGLDISIIKSFVKADDNAQKKKVFSSGSVFIVFLLFIFIVIYLLAGDRVSALLNIAKPVLAFAIIYTIFATIKQIFDIAIRSQEKFKVQAIGKVVEIIFTVIAFSAFLVFVKNVNFGSYVLVLVSGMLALSIYYLKHVRGYLGSFSLGSLKSQLSEGRFFMLSALLGNIFITSDRLVVNKFISTEMLGVYSAYYLASVGLVAIVGQLFSSVLLPASAKIADKNFSKKLDQLFLKGIAPVFLIICGLIFIFLTIFGRAYPLRIDYMVLFALISSLFFFQILYQTIIFDASRKIYFKYFLFSNSLNILTVVGYYLATRFISKSILVILIIFVLNLTASLIVQKIFVNKMRNK